MKKILFSLVAVSAAFTLQAQVIQGNMITERTKFGVKAGGSFATQTLTEYGIGTMNEDIRSGFTAGLEAEIPIRNGWYVQPEVSYSNMGARSYQSFINNQTGEEVRGMVKYAHDQIQVPVLFKYRPIYSGLGVYFGPQLGVLMQSKEIPPAGFNAETTTNDYTKAEIDGVFGVEYYFPNMNDKAPRFGLSARYVQGFSNIFKDNPSARPDGSKPLSTAQGKLTNAGFQVTLGVRF